MIIKKKVLFVLLGSILFSYSCSPTYYQKEVHTYVYDFTDYTKKGFLFTPEQYLGNYESIGIIDVKIYPQTEYKEANSTEEDENDSFKRGSNKWIYYIVSTQEVLDSLYNRASIMGADAVVRLIIQDFDVNYGKVSAVGKRASGFAIKRKEQ